MSKLNEIIIKVTGNQTVNSRDESYKVIASAFDIGYDDAKLIVDEAVSKSDGNKLINMLNEKFKECGEEYIKSVHKQCTLVRSNFSSPAYGVKRIPIDELVSQKANPNSMTGKSWDALQQSICNTGYTFPVIAATNGDYDPATEGKEKPDLIEHSDGENTFTSSGKVGTQVSDDEIAMYFKYRLIDGSHRTQIVRLGTYYFNNGYDNSENWIKGIDIPEKPGLPMLAYLAWRENFSVPCVLLEIDETKQMSAEILHNTARGSHSLDSMKDIVYNLINVAGMSPEWVSQNLYLDLESIKRMQQLSGLKAAMNDIDDCDMAWSPLKDNSYQRKMTAYLIREATNHIERYKKENPDADISSSGTAVDIALEIGFADTEVWKQHGELYTTLLQ